jgi:hypothetical protein
MGNTELKLAFNSSIKQMESTHQKYLGFSDEILNEQSLIRSIYSFVTTNMLNGTEPDLQKIFPESNVVDMDDCEEILKQQAVQQISSNLLSGFASGEGHLSNLTN